jgi:sec-independent protein translocase protein TatB
MLDVGFWEIAIIGVIALIIIGPEKMPELARRAGHTIGKIKSFISNVTQDIQDELDLDELKETKEQLKQLSKDSDPRK